jgi:uncharacterized protein (TIGR03437 family)
MINDAGTLVVYESGRRLSAYAVAASSTFDLITAAADPPGFGASISDDGTQVAFLYGQNPQVYVIRSDGTGLRQITNFPEAVKEVELSGDGSIAFAVTAANRIVRIDVTTAQWTDIVPPTPYTSQSGCCIQVHRGEVFSVTGSGFAADSTKALPPFPLVLDGVELRVGGSPVPVAGVSQNSIDYPVPWDLPDGPVDVEVRVLDAGASPFVAGFEVEPALPSFYPTPMLVAAHQEFQALVSADNPAQPGEYVHVFARDLGPVIPAPPAGLPAPLQPVSELAEPLACTFGQDTNPHPVPVEVTFAGLAPGLLNVFQIDVHLPSSFHGSPSRLHCQIGNHPSVEYYVIGGFLAVP